MVSSANNKCEMRTPNAPNTHMGNGVLTLCLLKTALKGFVTRWYHLNATKSSVSLTLYIINVIKGKVGFVDFFF